MEERKARHQAHVGAQNAKGTELTIFCPTVTYWSDNLPAFWAIQDILDGDVVILG